MSRIIYRTKSELIFKELKQDIISGRYLPNQKIIMTDVATEFGTSEIPVREAIKGLESEGLVKNVPYVGVTVTSINVDGMEKIYPIRMVTEGLAARMAAKKIKANDLRRLEKVVEGIEQTIFKEQYEEASVLNREFHKVICKAAENEYLYKVIEELWNLCLRSPALYVLMPEITHRSNQEHKTILAALEKRDGISAERLIIQQTKNSLKSFQEYHRIQDKK